MRERIKRILLTILVAGLAVGTALFIGIHVPEENWRMEAQTISQVCHAILAIAAIIGTHTMNVAIDKSQEEVDVAADDLELKEHRQRAETNYEAEKRRILRFLNWGTAYFWFIYVTLFIGMASMVLLEGEYEYIILFIPAYLVWLYSLNGAVCLNIEEDGYGTPMKEKEYPFLSNVVKDVFHECGVKGRIKLYMQHQNTISVAKTKGVNHVVLGAKAVGILDEVELRQALIHEAAHIKNKDAQLSYRLAKGYEKWNYFSSSRLGRAGIAPVYILSYLYSKEYYLFDETSSHAVELNADRFAASVGDCQEAVNGLAKISMFDCWDDEYIGNGARFYLRNEKLEKGSYTRQIQSFKESLKKKEADWRTRIENRLLVDTSSHPTFLERKELMKIDEYQVCFKENPAAYEEERKKLVDQAEQEFYESLLPEYEGLRKELYLEPMEKIEAYRAGNLGNDLFTKIQTAELCEDLCLYDEAYELYEQIRKEDPANATAAYGIGRIKLMRKDKSGIQDIYDSLDNHNDTDEKLEEIGNYCIEMGLASEYAYWNEYKNDKLDYYFNRYDKIADCWDAEILSYSDLNKELIERRTREILALGNGMIEKIYLVKKQLGDDCRMDTFLLRPNKDAKEEPWEEMMERVFLLLDNDDDAEEVVQYGLRCLWDEPELEPIVSQVEGTCIFSK